MPAGTVRLEPSDGRNVTPSLPLCATKIRSGQAIRVWRVERSLRHTLGGVICALIRRVISRRVVLHRRRDEGARTPKAMQSDAMKTQHHLHSRSLLGEKTYCGGLAPRCSVTLNSGGLRAAELRAKTDRNRWTGNWT